MLRNNKDRFIQKLSKRCDECEVWLLHQGSSILAQPKIVLKALKDVQDASSKIDEIIACLEGSQRFDSKTYVQTEKQKPKLKDALFTIVLLIFVALSWKKDLLVTCGTCLALIVGRWIYLFSRHQPNSQPHEFPSWDKERHQRLVNDLLVAYSDVQVKLECLCDGLSPSSKDLDTDVLAMQHLLTLQLVFSSLASGLSVITEIFEMAKRDGLLKSNDHKEELLTQLSTTDTTEGTDFIGETDNKQCVNPDEEGPHKESSSFIQ